MKGSLVLNANGTKCISDVSRGHVPVDYMAKDDSSKFKSERGYLCPVGYGCLSAVQSVRVGGWRRSARKALQTNSARLRWFSREVVRVRVITRRSRRGTIKTRAAAYRPALAAVKGFAVESERTGFGSI
ncbi:hypothetical protein EVAR_44631_1 [Eumeta japonica]|uniref:Uncharacterized protein n=1 Tax=Eumeta variegata TaxID=151549 RepID=A0A4C1Z1A9_EUMVA|nr:hypothetical protein EVAR_44631_1 [Eumeta japonica]